MTKQKSGEIAAQTSSGPVQSKVKKVNLPTIEITPFYGSYKSWLEFRDAFTSMVDNDEDLTPIQKFFYLKSLVKGDTAEVIQSLEVCDKNYTEAWNLLRDSFENNKLIALSHIESICEFAPMQKESYTGLKRFLDEIRKTVRVLTSLKLPVDTWDVLLIYLLEKKLDPTTRNEWKKKCSIKSFQKMSEFIDFLSHRCQYLYSNNPREGKFGEKGNVHRNQVNDYSKGSKVFVTSNETCFLCKQPHQIFQCKTFIEMPIQSKRDEVKKANLCWNCLRHGHIVQNCTSRGCKYCGKKHNSLLHADRQEQITKNTSNVGINESRADVSETNDKTQGVNNETTSLTTNVKVHSEILLSTALVLIKDKFGKSHECRALLDSGSQSNFITKDLCDKLQLSMQKTNVPVAGINQISTSVHCTTNATVSSKFNSYHINSAFLVLNKITDNLPVTTVNTINLNIPKNINLADITFNKSGKIDILLGATIFWDLLCVGQLRLGKGLPIIQKTKLGWVISGTVPPMQTSLAKQTRICNFSIEQNDGLNLQDQLERFWKIESVQNQNISSKEEKECEDIFVKTTERNEEGRFIVNLPLRDNIEELGDSYTTALKRFHNLEKRLTSNEEFGKQYRDFMEEYEELGHMTKIEDPLTNRTHKVVYYLPHHGVLRETSATTKLRVVFDGSAETDSGISLNQKLMVGPKIQDDLFDILIRFRKHNYVIAADVAKMYRQVLVREEHRDLQRILWRPSIDEPVCHYHLNTVTYGTASASFLAIRCLQQVGLDNKDKFPAASKVILKDFYVDDLLSGARSWEGAKRLRQELSAVLSEAGFPLRKWLSNDDRVLEDKANKEQQIEHFISDDKVTKTLGLLWNSDTDILQYKINLHSQQSRTTKRSILSVVSQIFDPLGLVGPTIIKAKIILQKLWQLKFGWDEAVPVELHTIWVQFLEQINFITMENRLPRHVICKEPIDIQLHGFCDASMSAYGACIFIRSTDRDNNHEVRLLCAKSRVSPLKTISLPRLELCGAHLLAKLTKNVLEAIDLEVNKVYLWCDSTIVLSWIAGESSQWKTFVANRTSEIQQITEGFEWRHVMSEHNPADILSRGMDPRQLAECKLWWNGPSWLQKDIQYWSKSAFIKPSDIPEQRNLALVSINHNDFNIFDKFSSLVRLQRVIAYCLRFKRNTTNHKNNKILGTLTVDELNESLNLLIKLAQLQEFSLEINSLKRSKRLPTSSKLLSLNPFLDSSGIMRVGGRLQRADITYNQRHPPSKKSQINKINHFA